MICLSASHAVIWSITATRRRANLRDCYNAFPIRLTGVGITRMLVAVVAASVSWAVTTLALDGAQVFDALSQPAFPCAFSLSLFSSRRHQKSDNDKQPHLQQRQ